MRTIFDPRRSDPLSLYFGCGVVVEGESGERNNFYSAELAQRMNGYLDKPCDGEIEYLLQFMRRIHGPSLELACGAMRVMMRLALHGYEVYGLDGSIHMIKLGQRRVAELPSEVQRRIHVFQGDMRDFSLKRTFEFIMIPFNSLWHNLNETEVEQCIAAIVRHLSPEGTFLIDTPAFHGKREWWRAIIEEKFSLVLRTETYTTHTYNDFRSEMLIGTRKTP